MPLTPTNSTIKTIIFDLGRVLLSYEPEQYLRQKYNNPETITALMTHIFNSPEWVLLDRGILNNAQAAQKMAANSPRHRDEITECVHNWVEQMSPIEGTVETLKKVKEAGYKTLILSNFHREAFATVSTTHDFFRHFDGGVISFQTGHLKPEPAIYNQLIEKYNLNPGEALFIDDMPKNITAAQKTGIEAILFQTPEKLSEDLAARGII